MPRRITHDAPPPHPGCPRHPLSVKRAPATSTTSCRRRGTNLDTKIIRPTCEWWKAGNMVELVARPYWTPYWTFLLGNGPVSSLVALICSLPPKTWGKTLKSSKWVNSYGLLAIWKCRRSFLTPYWIVCYIMGHKHNFYGLNVFLAPKNIEIDTKIIKIELIVTELRSLRQFWQPSSDAILKKTHFRGSYFGKLLVC